MKRLLYICLLAVIVSSCGLTSRLSRETQYASMYENMPTTVLVMPPINNTTHVEAKDLLYTSISRPLAEAGYYVISPLLAMDILKSESAYDSELFIDKPLTAFRDFFGADAVVFSQIDDWTKRGFGIDTKQLQHSLNWRHRPSLRQLPTTLWLPERLITISSEIFLAGSIVRTTSKTKVCW